MAKKNKVSAADLSWMITDLMNQSGRHGTGFVVAVVPDGKSWRSILPPRPKFSPDANKTLASIVKKLQATTDLKP